MTAQAHLAATINAAFDERMKFTPGNVPADVVAAVEQALSQRQVAAE
jgi:hypothetical protein